MPFRAARSTRSGRPGAPNDADVFDGLPVRQWRRHEQTIGIVEEDQPTSEGPQAQGLPARDGTPEPPMPKGSEYYTPWCRELLRLARSGKLPQKTNKPPNNDTEAKKAGSDKENAGIPTSDDKEVDTGFGYRGTKRSAEQGFPALRWGLISRALEEPEPNRLAKRRKGLPPLHATIHLDANVPMRKTKVKRTDAEGQSTVFEVMVPEGQTVEGEIKEEITLENAGAAIAAPKPGTFVEGLGVTNEQGVVIASEGIAPLKRKGPVAFRRKKKRGPGRWQQKLSDMTTGGVSASAEALEERKRREKEASRKVEGQAEGDKEEQHDAEEDDDGESGDDAEDGDEDDDREEGELSPDGKQDAETDDTMLLDEELPPPSEVTQSTRAVVDGSAPSVPNDSVPTLAVESGDLKRPRIPGLTASQNITDAIKDVRDEPAPDRNVLPAFETPTTDGKEHPSSSSQSLQPPVASSDMTQDSIPRLINQVHTPSPSTIQLGVDIHMQDVSSETTASSISITHASNAANDAMDETTLKPRPAEALSHGTQVVSSAASSQPPELMSVIDDGAIGRPISPSQSSPIQPAVPDHKPAGSSTEGAVLDKLTHRVVDEAPHNITDAEDSPRTRGLAPDESATEAVRDTMVPLSRSSPADADTSTPEVHVPDRHDGVDGRPETISQSDDLARGAVGRDRKQSGSAGHGSGAGEQNFEAGSAIDAADGKVEAPAADAGKTTTYQPHPEDIPFIPSNSISPRAEAGESQHHHPEDIPFIPTHAYESTTPVHDATTATTTTSVGIAELDPASPSHPSIPTVAASVESTSADAIKPSHTPPQRAPITEYTTTFSPQPERQSLSPEPERPSLSPQSPQRPEMEELTPEPEHVSDGSQQDVHFEDGDVDLIGSADGRSARGS